jgi:hypothetical protein
MLQEYIRVDSDLNKVLTATPKLRFDKTRSRRECHVMQTMHRKAYNTESHLKSALQSTKTQHKYTKHVARDPEAALDVLLHHSPCYPKERTRKNSR